MAANLNAIFVLTGAHKSVVVNAANTAADGTGTLFDLVTGAADGTRMEGIVFTSSQATTGASAARVMRIFITDENGANPVLYAEQALAAVTRTNTTIGATATYYFDQPLLLNSGQKIKISQTIRATAADDTACVALAQDY